MVQSSLSKSLAAALAIAASVGVAPAHADQPLTNLGPVGPHEPILVTMGTQKVIAFYVPERGSCAVNAVTWREGEPDAPYASARIRISLKPGQMFALDGSQRHSISLVCGADAASLAAVAPADLILAGGTSGN